MHTPIQYSKNNKLLMRINQANLNDMTKNRQILIKPINTKQLN